MSKARKGSKRQDSGNTNTESKEYRSLFFTYNNPSKAEKAELLKWLKNRKNFSYIFQEETGENGTPHLQGCFKSKSSIKFDSLKKMFPRIHWEKTISWDDAIEYCSKEETRTGEIYKSDDIYLKEKIEDPLEGMELYDYQKEILEIIKTKPNSRTIHWYWCRKGNSGKSSLVKHIYLNNMNTTLIANGKGNDIRNLINNHVNIEKKPIKTVIFDIPRTCEEYVSYEVMEQIKNGLLYSGKYEGGTCVFNTPHLIIFANFQPKKKMFSKDRWHIVEINSNIPDSDSSDETS